MRVLSIAAFFLILSHASGFAGDVVAKETVNPRDGYELVNIPAGEFLMGTPDGEGNDDEQPRHKVYLDGYSVGRHEVSVAQYRIYCRESGQTMPDPAGHDDNDPVTGVTWFDAVAYCGWAGLRLPTEAEWEKAARGGASTTYWWGDVASHNMANYTGKGGRDRWDDVSPVGSFPPNAFGLFDTAGNVWEWCQDRYGADYYRNSPDRNPSGPSTGDSRVLRGGSWDSPADFIRPARRAWDTPDYSSPLLGFRCAGGK